MMYPVEEGTPMATIPQDRQSVYDEPYYQNAPATTRLDTILPDDPRPLIVALVVIVAGAVKFGWELRGLWGPIYDNRGWAALLIFSIVFAAVVVNENNRRSYDRSS
jgi:hypothetical protein